MPEETPSDGERLVRIETKLDIVVGSHGAQLTDHETRIRAQEARKTVSPRDLWLAVSGAIATSWILFQFVGAIVK